MKTEQSCFWNKSFGLALVNIIVTQLLFLQIINYIFLYYNEMSKSDNMSGHLGHLANPYALDIVALFS